MKYLVGGDQLPGWVDHLPGRGINSLIGGPPTWSVIGAILTSEGDRAASLYNIDDI